ncbi:antigen A [Desmospora sp. 8437]|nr:antigen A [Desmospora sp. 8437]
MSTGDKFVGKDVTVWIKDTSTPVFIGGQTEATFNRSADSVDVTSKKPSGQVAYREKLPGFKEWSVELSGFVVENDQAAEKLEEAYDKDELVIVQWKTPFGKLREGKAAITEYTEEAPLEDGYSYSLTLEGYGAYEVKDDTGGGVEG